MKFLDILGKGIFVLGFLLVATLGTAPDVPFHMLGLPLCAIGLFLAAVVRWKTGPALAPGLLPLLVLICSSYFAWRAFTSPVRHLGEMDVFLVGAFLCGFGMVWVTGKVRWIEPWLWVLSIAGCVFGILQVAVDDQIILLKYFGLERPVDIPHASGFFYNPNPYGTWCAMLLLLATSRLIQGGGGWPGRFLALLGALAAVVGLLLSFCRAAFFGTGLGIAALAVALVVVVARWKAATGRKVTVALLVFAGFGVVGWFASEWLEQLAQRRTTSGQIEDLANIQTRYPYWRTGLSQFLDFPATGAGSRSFSYESYRYWDASLPVNQRDPEYVHNEYIQLLADYGFTGLVMVLVLICAAYYSAFKHAARIAKRERTKDGRAKLGWCLGTIGAGTALLGDVYFSFSGHFAPMMLLAGIMLGGLGAIDSAVRRKRDAVPSRWVFPLVFAACLGVCGFLVWPGLGYGWATGRIYLAISFYQKDNLDSSRYLGIAEQQAELLPRFPFFFHAADFASMVATGSPREVAAPIWDRSLAWFEKAITAFPQSLDARLERAQVLQQLGRYREADEDYAVAVKLGENREFHYRAWMKWGEARRDRAIQTWQIGDTEAATRWLRLSLEAYDESKRIAWITPDNLRYKRGRENVEELIAFFRRTGEWPAAEEDARG